MVSSSYALMALGSLWLSLMFWLAGFGMVMKANNNMTFCG